MWRVYLIVFIVNKIFGLVLIPVDLLVRPCWKLSDWAGQACAAETRLLFGAFSRENAD